MRLLIDAHLNPDLETQWRAIELQSTWASQHPHLFDEDDIRLASGKQGRAGYHFVEWLGAILAHQMTGWHTLVGKYQMANHGRKRKLVHELGLADLLLKRPKQFGRTQGPDLLLFAPDMRDWMLVEVKGPGDSLRRGQPEYFKYLEDTSGRDIRLVRFREVAPRVRG